MKEVNPRPIAFSKVPKILIHGGGGSGFNGENEVLEFEFDLPI